MPDSTKGKIKEIKTSPRMTKEKKCKMVKRKKKCLA